MKRWAATTAAMLLALLGASMAPAHADPTNDPNAFTFPITCDGIQYTAVELPGQGLWVPALIIDGNGTRVSIPFSFNVTFTDLTTGETSSLVVSKQPANHQSTVTCTFNVTSTDPETGDEVNVAGSGEALPAPQTG
jgi:hypothetical protein